MNWIESWIEAEKNPNFHPKILFTDYRPYLEEFYESCRDLVDADYDTQIKALLDDGFSGSHIFSDELKGLGFETMQVINDNPISQATWLRQNNIHLTDQHDLSHVVRLQIESFAPDILYFTNVVQFESQFIRSLEKLPTVVSGWRGFPMPPDIDLSAYDIILTSFDRIMDEAKALGVQDVVRFHPGFPEDRPFMTEDRSLKWDVVFSGSVTHEHKTRIALLDLIAQMSKDPFRPFSFGLFMPNASALSASTQVLNQGARWADDMLRTLRDAQIVINIDVDAFGNQPPNMRLIEATGAGAFLMTPYHSELKNFFEPGVEVETFRNENELISKMLYFLDNPDQCEEIARNGQIRCLKDHNKKSRAVWFKDILTGALESRLSKQA